MKKILFVLASLFLLSALVFGGTTAVTAKKSQKKWEKKISVFGDVGLARNLNSMGKRGLFLQTGAQYRINAKLSAEAMLNYHFSAHSAPVFAGHSSYGAGLAAVYRIKLLERLALDIKAGVLLHWNIYMVIYSSPAYTYKYSADFGLQGGPGIEYMFLPNLGVRAGTTLNLVFPKMLWLGFSSGLVFKL